MAVTSKNISPGCTSVLLLKSFRTGRRNNLTNSTCNTSRLQPKRLDIHNLNRAALETHSNVHADAAAIQCMISHVQPHAIEGQRKHVPILKRFVAGGKAHTVPESRDIAAVAMNEGYRSHSRRQVDNSAASHRKTFLPHHPAARQNSPVAPELHASLSRDRARWKFANSRPRGRTRIQ